VWGGNSRKEGKGLGFFDKLRMTKKEMPAEASGSFA